MFVIEVVGLELLSKREIHSSHVRVSEAHVVVIVLQSSAKETFAAFTRDVTGFEMFVIIGS